MTHHVTQAQGRRPPLKVLLTVDTEFYADTPCWRSTGLREELKQHIWGETGSGEFGLRFQLDLLARHDLRASFMVESLHSLVTGLDPLKEIVSTIRTAGQEVELHTHTEWMDVLEPEKRPVEGAKPNIADYTQAEQERLLALGLEALDAAGAGRVVAHRAGNFAANHSTLHALRKVGLGFDTSYDVMSLRSHCQLRFDDLLTEARALDGVIELPVAWFYDVALHPRHAQLCACSFAELRHCLWQAWHAGWEHFVIVSHSFELLRRGIRRGRPATPRRLVVHRFLRLCEFLDAHRSYFQTTGFDGLLARDHGTQPPPIRSNPVRTAVRLVEQLVSRAL